MIISYKYRIKDSNCKERLNHYSFLVNQVWNFCVETQRKTESKYKSGVKSKWLSRMDFNKLVDGSSILLGLNTSAIRQAAYQFVISRDTHKRCPKFRISFGSKRSLGWIPFNADPISFNGTHATFMKHKYKVWNSRKLGGYIKSGCFTEDARGRWYIVFNCDVKEDTNCGDNQIGIDLGLKTLATCSDGREIPNLRFYKKYEDKLAKAQSSKKKKLVQTIHAKIKNTRKHNLHVESTILIKSCRLLVVGDVSSTAIIEKGKGKSVLDAGWFEFKEMLRYKARMHGASYIEVNEAYTTQICYNCNTIPVSSPKGTKDLRIRFWKCSNCGQVHNRDVNAAKNILRIGLEHQPFARRIG